MSDAPPDRPAPSAPPADSGEERVDRARRLLLKGTVYAAPVVLGLLEVRTAYAQGPSCPPTTCPPQGCGPTSCNPLGGGCGPDFCNPQNNCGPTGCKPRP